MEPPQQQQHGRILVVNPMTQEMMVLQGEAAAVVANLLSSHREPSQPGPPPASKASIEAMREVEGRQVDAEEECPICLDILLENKQIMKEMVCGHRYHGGCIDKWLGMHGCCPVCRFRMPTDDEEEEEDNDEEEDGVRRRRFWLTILHRSDTTTVITIGHHR